VFVRVNLARVINSYPLLNVDDEYTEFPVATVNIPFEEVAVPVKPVVLDPSYNAEHALALLSDVAEALPHTKLIDDAVDWSLTIAIQDVLVTMVSGSM
jgi:hypothetical protein